MLADIAGPLVEPLLSPLPNRGRRGRLLAEHIDGLWPPRPPAGRSMAAAAGGSAGDMVRSVRGVCP
eukprot:514580-Alexandrium_andersonii.AAC.1